MESGAIHAAILEDRTRPAGERGLAVVGGNRLSVAALAALLLTSDDVRMVSAAHGTEDVREALAYPEPTAVICDSSFLLLAQGLGDVPWKKSAIVLIHPDQDPSLFRIAVRFGAQAYVSATASVEALRSAIAAVQAHKFDLDPMLAGRVLQASSENHDQTNVAPAPQLSQREQEILALVATGRSSKEIAREYAITPKTVCNHISNMYVKLSLKNRGQLVLYATQVGESSVSSDRRLPETAIAGGA